MRTLLRYSALLAAAIVLAPVDGFAQGNQQGERPDNEAARERAQVERGQDDRDRARDRDRMRRTDVAPANDQLKAKAREQEQNREMVQEQKQIQEPEAGMGPDSGIYGYELMSVQERNQYREQLQLVQSDPEKKTRFLAQHREKMQVRAKARGITLEESSVAGKSQ